MNSQSTFKLPILKIKADQSFKLDDVLAIEEPLEIQINYGPLAQRISKSISVTMRTPGDDEDLAIGFLFTEGIITSSEVITGSSIIDFNKNKIRIEFNHTINPALEKLERNFYTTSSCGVCGKSSIDAIRIVCEPQREATPIHISSPIIKSLPDLLRQQQHLFESTGGIHAAALFSLKGEFIALKEDVGRHNALDKLIGNALKMNKLPLLNHILLLSGRASFELIQKAAMAGIKVVASVGAPSSLAVELAKEFNITLIGFLREDRFNIYCNEQRIIL